MLEMEILSLKSSVDTLVKVSSDKVSEVVSTTTLLRSDVDDIKSKIVDLESRPLSGDVPPTHSIRQHPLTRSRRGSRTTSPLNQRPVEIVRGSRKIWGTRRNDVTDTVLERYYSS